MPDDTSPSRAKKVMMTVGAAALAYFGIFFILALVDMARAPSHWSTESDVPPVSANRVTRSDMLDGVGVSRAELEEVMSPFGYRFEPAPSVRGLPQQRAVVSNIGCLVYLLGREESPVVMTVVMLPTSLKSYNRVAENVFEKVVSTVDSAGAAWALDRIARGRKKGLEEISSSFDGLNFALTIDRGAKQPTITLRIMDEADLALVNEYDRDSSGAHVGE